jgi:hypothetical protein
MNIPSAFMVLSSDRKFSTVRGENCEEYVVKTIIVVEKVKVVIVISDPAITCNIVLASSTEVKNRGGT